jgi:HEAT repeat protein
VLPELERFVGDPNLEVQGAVRKVIRGIRIAEAERGLIGDDPAERARAMGRIAEVEGKEIYKVIEAAPDPKYIAALTDVVVYELSSVERGKAVAGLLRIGTPKAYPALVFALRNPWNHGEPVVSWLGANGDLTVLFELERIGENNEYMGSAAHTIRTRFPGEKPREPKEWTPIDPAPFLKQISGGPSTAARIRAIRGAVNAGDRSDELLRSMGDVLADPDEELRFRAAEAFTFVGVGAEERRVEDVYRGESQSLRVRQMAAIALARMGGEAVRRRLVDTLSTGPAALRITVSEALGNSADLRLVDPLLKQAALQEEPAVREAVEKAARLIQEAHRKRDR